LGDAHVATAAPRRCHRQNTNSLIELYSSPLSLADGLIVFAIIGLRLTVSPSSSHLTKPQAPPSQRIGFASRNFIDLDEISTNFHPSSRPIDAHR
jgi:hypothetical protein